MSSSTDGAIKTAAPLAGAIDHSDLHGDDRTTGGRDNVRRGKEDFQQRHLPLYPFTAPGDEGPISTTLSLPFDRG